MKDKTHEEFLVMWANFVKTHPISEWKPQVSGLVDSQISMANSFYERLAKTPGGMDKIRKLRRLE